MITSKAIFCAIVCASAVSVFAQINDADMNNALNAIEKRNMPRYLQYNHQQICDEFAEFGKTNELTYAQSVVLTRRIAYWSIFLNDGEVLYKKSIASLNAATNETIRLNEQRSLINAFTHIYRGAKEYRAAEAIFAEISSKLDSRTRMIMDSVFVRRGVALFRDRAIFDKYFNSAIAEICTGGPNIQVAFNKDKASSVLDMIGSLCLLNRDDGMSLFVQYRDIMSETQHDRFYINQAKICKDYNDRPAFDKIVAQIRNYPLERRVVPYCEILEIMNSFDSTLANSLLAEALADKTLSPAQRFTYLSLARSLSTPSVFNYGFNNPGEYKHFRDIVREQIAIEDANPTNTACRVSNADWMNNAITRVIWFDDLDFADELIRRNIAHRPNNGEIFGLRARVRAIRGDTAGAVEDLKSRLGYPRFNNEANTNCTLAIVAFLEGRSIKGFDAAFASAKLSTASRLNLLRQASRELFNMRRYADCQAIFKEINEKTFIPYEPKVHIATYYKNAPKSADGFVRTELYNQWNNMETRFVPYGDSYGASPAVDEKRNLKDAKQPKVNEDYRTGVRVIYDDEGVHIFIRCDDPAIQEVKLGKRATAGDLELFLRPGDQNVAYHSIFMTDLPGTSDPHDADWAMPDRHYRRSKDIIFKDAALTAEGCVAHISIPWMSFYDNLPLNGNNWKLGVIRNCPGGMQTVGGVVHELSRGMIIKFDFSKRQLINLKRNVALSAFNRYNRIRNTKGGFIWNWNDVQLGDKAFYEAVVAPMLEELDNAGKALIAPAPDNEIEKFFVKFTPLWAEIQYEIDERRTRYLNDKFFSED